jgi:hypothetical protein
MPSFFVSQDKRLKCPSTPSTSLLRRFNDLYKPSTTPLSSLVPNARGGKAPQAEKTLLSFDKPVRVSLFPLDTVISCRSE